MEGLVDPVGAGRIGCCCSDSVIPARRTAGKSAEKSDDWRLESLKIAPTPAMPFASPQYVALGERFVKFLLIIATCSCRSISGVLGICSF